MERSPPAPGEQHRVGASIGSVPHFAAVQKLRQGRTVDERRAEEVHFVERLHKNRPDQAPSRVRAPPSNGAVLLPQLHQQFHRRRQFSHFSLLDDQR